MKGESYPLDSVRTLRERAEQAAEQRLADAMEAHRRARQVRAHAARKLRDFRAAEATRVAEEHDRLQHCTAVEWIRAEAYRERQRDRAQGLAAARARARRAEACAAEAVRDARLALSERARDRRVVDRHAERWDAERDRAREKRAQEELDDWASHTFSKTARQ